MANEKKISESKRTIRELTVAEMEAVSGALAPLPGYPPDPPPPPPPLPHTFPPK